MITILSPRRCPNCRTFINLVYFHNLMLLKYYITYIIVKFKKNGNFDHNAEGTISAVIIYA